MTVHGSQFGKRKKRVRVKEVWWIERDDGTRIDGPFSTIDDASRARRWVEIVMKPETFWIRNAEAQVTP